MRFSERDHEWSLFVLISLPTGKRNASASQPSEIPASRIAEIACPDEWAICGHKPEKFTSAQKKR